MKIKTTTKTTRPPLLRVHLDPDEIVVDNFAGGGGASSGIEWAIGRSPDIAINHDAEAIDLHRANHPSTKHYVEDIWDVDPKEACGGRRVGLVWCSPDCKHFSKAKGTVPLDQKIRGLAWAAVRWATDVKPRIICLENVEEFRSWGPLGKDGMPIKARAGETFNEFVGQLEALGYKVEHRLLRACDYGAPTNRRRLFLIARCDGHPIAWPEPTHGPSCPLPFRTAAECIDWSVEAPSIFGRKKNHAEKTLARIARGIRRYVVQAEVPFLAPIAGDTVVAPYLVHRSNGERPVKVDADGTVHAGQAPRVYPIDAPLGTIMAQGQKQALVNAFLLKHNGGNNDSCGASGQELTRPIDSITSRDSKSLATVSLALAGDPEAQRRARAVYSFLVRYNGKGEPEALTKPLGTLTTHDRYGLVTVTVGGQDYVIVDIGMRMLTPRELFNAQGFASDYNITAEEVRGEPLTKTAQVRCVGNSVAPPIAAAIVRAQFGVAASVSPSVTQVTQVAPVTQLRLPVASPEPEVLRVGNRVSFLDDAGKRRVGEVLRVGKRTVTIDAAGWEWGIAPRFVDKLVARRQQRGADRRTA